MADSEQIQAIIDKVKQEIPLTREEDLLYLVEVVGLTPEKAENVLAINEETSASVIVD